MTDWYKTSQSWTKGDGDCMQVAANLMMDLHYNFNQLKSEIGTSHGKIAVEKRHLEEKKQQ